MSGRHCDVVGRHIEKNSVLQPFQWPFICYITQYG